MKTYFYETIGDVDMGPLKAVDDADAIATFEARCSLRSVAPVLIYRENATGDDFEVIKDYKRAAA